MISRQKGSYPESRFISWIKILDRWTLCLWPSVSVTSQRLCPPISPSRVGEGGCHMRQRMTQRNPIESSSEDVIGDNRAVLVSQCLTTHSTYLTMFMRWLLLKSVTRDNRTTLVLFSRFLRFSDFSTPAPGNVDERVNDYVVTRLWSPETTEHPLCLCACFIIASVTQTL